MITRLLIAVFIFSFCLNSFSQSIEEKIVEKKNEIIKLDENRIKLQDEIEDLKLEKVIMDIKKTGLPKVNPGDFVIYHSAMALCYDDDNEQAKWVSHVITPDIIEGNTSRTNDFREDTLIKKGSATKDDYWFSGYDRGHLAPSADFRWSLKALSESYYYSNMSPQKPELNRERWAELEGKIRSYVIENKNQVYVVTGGVLKGEMEKIGKNKVSVPNYFYKVILDIDNPEQKAIGFVMPNKYCKYPVISYAVSVDSVEALTGIDFFASLDDELEEKLESKFDVKKWLVAKEKNDVPPIDSLKLPAGTINTVQAKSYIGKKAVVCGTVVSTKLSAKSGAVFINLDTQFPNQIFSATIWKNNRTNFSYKPEIELNGKRVCITGQVQDYKGVPSVQPKSEKEIQFLDDEEEEPIIPPVSYD